MPLRKLMFSFLTLPKPIGSFLSKDSASNSDCDTCNLVRIFPYAGVPLNISTALSKSPSDSILICKPFIFIVPVLLAVIVTFPRLA